MAQVVSTEILDTGVLQCIAPGASVRVNDGLALERENSFLMLAGRASSRPSSPPRLFCQHRPFDSELKSPFLHSCIWIFTIFIKYVGDKPHKRSPLRDTTLLIQLGQDGFGFQMGIPREHLHALVTCDAGQLHRIQTLLEQT